MLQADFIENTGNAADDAKAIELYEEALKIDSMNSEIWSHLAFTHWKQKSEKARDIAAKAIALDPMNGHAYFVMGLIKRNFDWEWKEAKHTLIKHCPLMKNKLKAQKLGWKNIWEIMKRPYV